MPTSSFFPAAGVRHSLSLLSFFWPDVSHAAVRRNRPPYQPEAVTPRSTESDLDPRAMATLYMCYAYLGALLRSDHPLNDSLSALMDGPVGGNRSP